MAEPYLKGNKAGNKPHYYCFEDATTRSINKGHIVGTGLQRWHKGNKWIEAKKQERQKEIVELEQTISGSKEELFNILHQQIVTGQETDRQSGRATKAD